MMNGDDLHQMTAVMVEACMNTDINTFEMYLLHTQNDTLFVYAVTFTRT